MISVLEDTMVLLGIKEVPQMALDAGFTNVRVFVYRKERAIWPSYPFGPVVKHNLNHVPERMWID